MARRYITHDITGETRTLGEWARIIGIHYSTLIDRLDYRGMTLSQAMAVKKRTKKPNSERKPLPCGAKKGLDCLECKYAMCICPNSFLPEEYGEVD